MSRKNWAPILDSESYHEETAVHRDDLLGQNDKDLQNRSNHFRFLGLTFSAKSWMTREVEDVNARCRDLLYVTENAEEAGIFKFQVDILHRTVRDFFLETRVKDDIIQQRPTRSLDPNPWLCKIMPSLSKIMAIDESNSQVYTQVFTLADSLMYYARKIEESHVQASQEGARVADCAAASRPRG
ncbi:hypothetical protein ACJZ2D_013228 [Fusarium nematophilum]